MSQIVKEYIRQMSFIAEAGDISSDAYNNCILIQKCIEHLCEHNAFSAIEKDVLKAMIMGFSYMETARLLRVGRKTVAMVFDRVAYRISFLLGGEFSDSNLEDRIGMEE